MKTGKKQTTYGERSSKRPTTVVLRCIRLGRNNMWYIYVAWIAEVHQTQKYISSAAKPVVRVHTAYA